MLRWGEEMLSLAAIIGLIVSVSKEIREWLKFLDEKKEIVNQTAGSYYPVTSQIIKMEVFNLKFWIIIGIGFLIALVISPLIRAYLRKKNKK